MKKKMKNYVVALALLAMCLGPIGAFAQGGSQWTAADNAAAMKIKYVGSGVATVTVTATSVTLSDDGLATAVVLGPVYTNLAELAGALNTVTNTSGKRNFRTKLWAGIASDATTNRFIAVSATALDRKQWTETIKWDTSAVKHYAVVSSSQVGDSVLGGEKITRIVGDITGTGNVTLNVYDGGSVVYQKTIVSPVYHTPAHLHGAGITTNTADALVSLDVDLGSGIRIKKGNVGFVRATRATTATTGGIGVSVLD